MNSDTSAESNATTSDAPPPDGADGSITASDAQLRSDQSDDYDSGLSNLDDELPTVENKIAEAVDALHSTIAKAARLSRRLTRALDASTSANEACTDAYASVLVLKDHDNVGQANANNMARRTSHLKTAVRDQASSTVTAFRAVAVLDADHERSQKARAEGARCRAALDAAIQADDGDLDHHARQSAQKQRRHF